MSIPEGSGLTQLGWVSGFSRYITSRVGSQASRDTSHLGCVSSTYHMLFRTTDVYKPQSKQAGFRGHRVKGYSLINSVTTASDSCQVWSSEGGVAHVRDSNTVITNTYKRTHIPAQPHVPDQVQLMAQVRLGHPRCKTLTLVKKDSSTEQVMTLTSVAPLIQSHTRAEIDLAWKQ
ncbi:hypothetical protein RRG08_026047 [Elysia crispata]|uniref:Uncharacterized protein n=1 Tax=Elysia crispata TaxID=231223 RepID=A0AAE0YYW4_9GAST|nr:hypothetical protein RRG08_026047 [Elysia crispata]